MAAALQLNAAQVQRLQQIQLQRDTARLSAVLTGHFPDVPARVGERWPALLAHAVERGRAHGLAHALSLARYLGCWFVLGAEFEARPGFEWAKQLLADPQRGEGAKVFQLCRRTREALVQPGRLGTAPMTGDAFERAIAGVDADLVDFGPLGSLVRGGRLALGQACDFDAVDLRLADAGVTAQGYRFEHGEWQRLPRAVQAEPVSLRAGAAPGSPAAGGAAAAGVAAGGAAAGGVGAGGAATAGPAAGGAVGGSSAPAGSAPGGTVAGAAATATVAAARPSLPPRLYLLAAPPGTAAPVRLRLRTSMAACCDGDVHPLLVLNGVDGIHEQRGRHAADVTFELHAQPPADPPAADADAPQPAIAAETAAQISTLSLSSCGLRDGGLALGELSTQIAVYPAQQHLMTWRREARPLLAWPEPAGGQPVPSVPARCCIERDGTALDSSRWQAGFAELDRQLDAGLARLYSAWERESGVEQARMEAEPALLCGDAGLSWGWADGPLGLRSLPFLRLAGRLELIACRLNLRLGGELALQGSRSRVALHSHGSTLLRQPAWQRGAADAELLPAQARVAFRHPFVVELQTLAQAELATVGASPASGAVVGSAGLRPRADGAGLQWFAKLDVEAVQVLLHWHDPLLGRQTLPRPLLPALPLVDWSLG